MFLAQLNWRVCASEAFPSLGKPTFRKGHYARIFLLDLALVLGSFGIVCRSCACRFVLCDLELFECDLWHLRSFMKTTSYDYIPL